jgi:hypothetical protein
MSQVTFEVDRLNSFMIKEEQYADPSRTPRRNTTPIELCTRAN